MARIRQALAELLMRLASACISAAERLDPIDLPPGLAERKADLLAAAERERANQKGKGEGGSRNGSAPHD